MHILRDIFYKIVQVDNRKFAVFTIVFIFTHAFLFQIIEPETFGGFFTSLWYVLVTITTVGYGDFYPTSVLGKSLAMFLFITGIGLGGVVIGKVVDAFSNYRKRREEGKLDFRGENHIVIVGWTEKTDAAIKEILANNNIDVVVIDQLEKAPYLEDRIYYVQGSPTKKETLEKANIRKAKACIIFSDDKIRDYDEKDAKNLLISSAIEGLSTDIYTIVEINNPEHTDNFKHNKVNKYLYPQSTISHLAVQEALNNGITEIFNQLGSVQEGVNLYVVKKRPQWVTYRDAFMDLLEEGATLLADGENLDINTRLDDKIPEDNRLIVVCSEGTYHNKLLTSL